MKRYFIEGTPVDTDDPEEVLQKLREINGENKFMRTRLVVRGSKKPDNNVSHTPFEGTAEAVLQHFEEFKEKVLQNGHAQGTTVLPLNILHMKRALM